METSKAGWQPIEATPDGPTAAIDRAERDMSLATSSQELLAAAEKLFELLPVTEHKTAASKVSFLIVVPSLSLSLSHPLAPSLLPSG